MVLKHFRLICVQIFSNRIPRSTFTKCKFVHLSTDSSTGNKQERLHVCHKMPKPVTHTVALKKHRQQLKEKSQKYVPGTVNLQVLGSGANGAPRSLYVFTDQSRYLFNCGEGTQRLAHEHKMKLSKLEHIFVTHPSWDNMGGLPGVSLTIQDVGVPQITLHGPPGVDEIFIATRRFVVLRHLAVKMANCASEMLFEDNVMKVQYVPLYAAAAKQWLNSSSVESFPDASLDTGIGSEDSTDDDVDYYAYWQTGSRSHSPLHDAASPSHYKKRRYHSPVSKRAREDMPPPGSISMAFVCRLQDRPGTLNLQACVTHGVPPGPLLGRLKAGEDITLPCGKVVRSSDVTSPLEPGPLFIVIECPSEEFLDALEDERVFQNHQELAEVNNVAFLVVHFSPPNIMTHPRYQKWMSQFSPSTHHLVLNSANSCLGSVAVHRIQHKLHLLSPHLFPLLSDSGIPLANQQQVTEENGLDKMKQLFSIVRGSTLGNVHLRPQRMIDCSPKLVLEPEVYRQETMSVEEFPAVLATLQDQLKALGTPGQPYPQVVFLGTGSCIPNKTRNTSGIILHLSENSSIVLDCGEATYGQILRLYGEVRTTAILRGLRAVYVSHLHADHHIGLVGLLRAWHCVSPADQPLYLLAPRQIRSWLNTYHRHFEPVLTGVQLVPNGDLLMDANSVDDSLWMRMLQHIGLSRINTCLVRHCPNAFGICLQHPNGWKITYSGDTMPCDNLIKLGMDSDLLIHEATMEDDLEGEAQLKMHSTTSQAVQVGQQMKAKFTLLTHFSQRYAKVPIFNDSLSSNVGIAFDNMQVSLGELAQLPLMYPALKLMFAEHYEEMELKALKRQLNFERNVNVLS